MYKLIKKAKLQLHLKVNFGLIHSKLRFHAGQNHHKMVLPLTKKGLKNGLWQILFSLRRTIDL